MYDVNSWSRQRSEEGVGSPRIGVTGSLSGMWVLQSIPGPGEGQPLLITPDQTGWSHDLHMLLEVKWAVSKVSRW